MAEEKKHAKEEMLKKEKESADRMTTFQKKAAQDLELKLKDQQMKTQTILAELNVKHEKESKMQLSQVEN